MDDSSRLCTHCALCCDGRLFDGVTIAEGDEPAIRAAGLAIVHGDAGEIDLELPCHYLSNGCCTRYETRFHACRSFKCELLRAVRQGRVDLTSAMAIVDEAKRRLAAAEKHLEGPATRRARRAKLRELGQLQRSAKGPERDAQARAQLDLITATLFLQRHFRRPGEAELKQAAPGTEGVG